jgi:hypothetical protein
MDAKGVETGFRRRSRAEADRLVAEFGQSGLGRGEFCAAHGLSVHTLDAWRRRIALGGTREEIVPVEIVADRRARIRSKAEARSVSTPARSMEGSGQFRVLLADGLRIEVEAGFDAAELRRLIAALEGVALRNGLRQSA